jgi:hypothetical protein
MPIDEVGRRPTRPVPPVPLHPAQHPLSAGALGDNQDTRQAERATQTATEAEGGSGSVRAPGTPVNRICAGQSVASGGGGIRTHETHEVAYQFSSASVWLSRCRAES